MLQPLSDPLFAVPFLGALLLGSLGVALGGGYAWLFGRRADSRPERLSARVGGVGLAGIGVAGVGFGWAYAGDLARLQRGPGVEPSLFGRAGTALPWELVASVVGAAAVGCVVVAMALSAYATWLSDTAN